MSLALRIAASTLRRPTSSSYGADPSQRGDLHLPRRQDRPAPVAVLLHGGYWTTRFGKLVCRPLAVDLARSGWAAWNLEYRRLGPGRGGGGGWPMTFADVADGIDHLAALQDDRLDLSRVVAVGHSAGGQLALWAAGRTGLPGGAVGSRPAVAVAAVAALAPVTDLGRAGVHAVALLGGVPADVPERWAQADPLRTLPPPVPTLVVHPEGDRTVSSRRSAAYADACRRAGGDVALVTPPGEGHRDPIDPTSASWQAARRWLEAWRSAA